MAEMLEESGQLESTTVGVFRTAATVKGGRRFSFSSLVVVGDRNGKVGQGYGKSNEVPSAIEKAQKKAKRAMINVPMIGSTIPHEVEGRFGASKVRLIPASPGTGVVAGTKVRAILELAGITDCLTKSYGSNNTINAVKAVFDGLGQLRLSKEVAELRGVEIGETEIENKIEKGKRYMPSSAGEKAKAPVNTIGQDRKGGRGGGRGGRGGRGGGGGGGGRRGAPPAPPQESAPPAEAPATAAPEAGTATK